MPNNGMHPTANSEALIENLPLPQLNARRVMPGVMPLSLLEVTANVADSPSMALKD
jgi:hypothetical protein